MSVNKKNLSIITVMGFTSVLIAGGLFGLLNSAMADADDSAPRVSASRTMESPDTARNAVTGAEAVEATACDFSSWVGQSRAAVESQVKATGRTYRMLPPGSMMTMDFRADRVNIELDGEAADAKVTKVSCG